MKRDLKEQPVTLSMISVELVFLTDGASTVLNSCHQRSGSSLACLVNLTAAFLVKARAAPCTSVLRTLVRAHWSDLPYGHGRTISCVVEPGPEL